LFWYGAVDWVNKTGSFGYGFMLGAFFFYLDKFDNITACPTAKAGEGVCLEIDFKAWAVVIVERAKEHIVLVWF